MKTNWLKISSALSLVMTATLVTACGAGDMNEFDVAQDEMSDEEGEYSSEEIELGSVEQASHNCANPDGTNAVMAALAVAAAQDLGRWRAGLDFQVVGWDRIALTSGTGTDGQPKGSSRCAGGVCKRILPLLALQNDNATGVYVQGETSTTKVLVNPSALRSRMAAKLNEQITKDIDAKDGDLNQIPKTPFTLAGAGTALLSGCGKHFKFNVAFGTPVTPPLVPKAAQLKWSLSFADQQNGWVDFKYNVDNVANRVAIDPTYGLNEGDSTSAGSCEIACSKVSPNSDVSNVCCSCGGAQKTFKKSTFNASLFLCQ
jgi:hypothetical protein